VALPAGEQEKRKEDEAAKEAAKTVSKN